MKRTNIYITEEQHERLAQMAQASGMTISDYIRRAIDWYLSQTVYIQDTDEMLEEVHPDMTPEQLVGWLKFRWRLHYEGKENGGQEIAMLEEILSILRRNDASNQRIAGSDASGSPNDNKQ